MDYEKILINTKKTDERIKKQIAERAKAINTRNKAYKIFDFYNDFVKGFDTMEEVNNFLNDKIKNLLALAEESKKLFGHYLGCDVKSPEEAALRVASYYSIRY